LLAAFADAVDVGAVSEVQIGACEIDQLGRAEPGLRGEQDQGVVAAAGPCRAVWSVQQRVEFGLGKEADQRPLESFGRDREDPLDRVGVLGMLERGVAEQ
jgi:hypothetical protein